MNLFLKNGRSFSCKKSKYSSDIKLNNKYIINTPSKKVINHRNKVYFLNPNYNKHNLFLKLPNESLMQYELTQPNPSKKKNTTNNLLSKTFDGNNSNISKSSTIKKTKKDKLQKYKSNTILYNINKYDIEKNKTLISLKKRKSVFNKGHNKLNKMYGLSMISNNPNSYNDNVTSPETFFTSIPVDINSSKKFNKKEENSKRNNQNLMMMSLIQKLKLNKNYYETLKLKELKNQVHKFENSESFQPNEQLIEKYLSSPDIFINKKNAKKKYKKKLKLFKENYNPALDKNKLIFTIHKKKSKESNYIYKTINYLEKESEIYKNNVINSKCDYNYEKTDNILKNALKKIDVMDDEVTEYLKKIAIDYKKEIGDFTFYRGKGIYTNHLAILKKNENLLAFMLSNDIIE